MEFKAVPASEKEALSEIAEEAIAKIDRRIYTHAPEERGIRRIVKYGIAFSGKAVEVKRSDDPLTWEMHTLPPQ